MRFNGWPELRRCSSPLARGDVHPRPDGDGLREQGVPIKIVYLGHRDGTALMVHKDSSIFRIEDLRGKKVAVPNRFRTNGLSDSTRRCGIAS